MAPIKVCILNQSPEPVKVFTYMVKMMFSYMIKLRTLDLGDSDHPAIPKQITRVLKSRELFSAVVKGDKSWSKRLQIANFKDE